MCVICIAEKARPSAADVDKMWQANPYGAGASWVENGLVHWRKGLTLKEVIGLSQEVAFPFILHFRIPTAGGDSDELNHPFELGGRLDLKGRTAHGVLFHNGHWPEWALVRAVTQASMRGKMPKGPWSDSRLMAYISRYGTEWLDDLRSQKVTVQTPTGIERFGTWNESAKDSGLWYSNDSWRYSFRGGGYHMSAQERAWEQDWERNPQGHWQRKAISVSVSGSGAAPPGPTNGIVAASGGPTGAPGGAAGTTPPAAGAAASTALTIRGDVISEGKTPDGAEIIWIRSAVISAEGFVKWNRFLKKEDGSLVEANFRTAPKGIVMKQTLDPVKDRWSERFAKMSASDVTQDYNNRAAQSFPEGKMGFHNPAVIGTMHLPPFREEEDDELGTILGEAYDFFGGRASLVRVNGYGSVNIGRDFGTVGGDGYD